jgi:hypothetical protein
MRSRTKSSSLMAKKVRTRASWGKFSSGDAFSCGRPAPSGEH